MPSGHLAVGAVAKRPCCTACAAASRRQAATTAAGVVATRIIDSDRERLIAILTNNFSLCNGRWPTQILLATLFVAAAFPREYGPTVAAMAVVGVLVLGIVLMFASSWALSRTVLRGPGIRGGLGNIQSPDKIFGCHL